jgi:hypothetical protein
MAFMMQQMRRVIALYPDAGQALHFQVNALEANVETHPHLCLALARQLLETCFKTIAQQRGIEPDKGFKDQAERALSCISHGLEGHRDESRIAQAFATLRDGLSRLALAMGELSNVEGMRHGADDRQPTLDFTRAQFFAAFADAACAFAYECHRAEPRPKSPDLADEPEFNAFLDETYPVEIAGVVVDASAALFYVDYEAYRAELEAWRPIGAATAEEETA